MSNTEREQPSTSRSLEQTPNPSMSCEFVRQTGSILPQRFAATANNCRYCNKQTENYCHSHWDLAVCEDCEPRHQSHAGYRPCYCNRSNVRVLKVCPQHNSLKEEAWTHWPVEKKKRTKATGQSAHQ